MKQAIKTVMKVGNQLIIMKTAEQVIKLVDDHKIYNFR